MNISITEKFFRTKIVHVHYIFMSELDCTHVQMRDKKHAYVRDCKKKHPQKLDIRTGTKKHVENPHLFLTSPQEKTR